MTAPTRRGRRRYAHRASSRREPIYAIAAGVIVVALCIPVAWRALSNDSNHEAAPKRVTSTSSAPRSSAAPTKAPKSTSSSPEITPPARTPIARTAPGIQIRVVPAVRDVQVMVNQTLYTATSDGVVNVPSARGSINVSYVGYSVIPALQVVTFRTWSDGITAPARTLDANGRGHVSMAIDVRYRVIVTTAGGARTRSRTLTATSSVGPVKFTEGARRWVLAARGERSSSGVIPRTIEYSFDPPRGASANRRQTFTAGPEALWTVRAP